MKSLNLLSFFKHPSILASALLIAGVVAFSSNASANEKNFDVLSGVSAEAMTPSAMDDIQGMGSIKAGFIYVKFPHIIVDRDTGGPWSITIRFEAGGNAKMSRVRTD